jgi:hypothetical protein
MISSSCNDLKNQVRLFLREFKMAAEKGSGIIYAGRDKNWDTLVDLNMTSAMRNECVLGLTWRDYCQGPLADERGQPGDLWVFGTNSGGCEIYIKLKLAQGENAVCISFHKAEFSMEYPLGR